MTETSAAEAAERAASERRRTNSVGWPAVGRLRAVSLVQHIYRNGPVAFPERLLSRCPIEREREEVKERERERERVYNGVVPKWEPGRLEPVLPPKIVRNLKKTR